MKYPLIAIFVLFACTTFAQNKTISLSGTVKEKTSKTPLPFVNIVLKHSRDSLTAAGTITNEKGVFTLVDLSSGEYVLEASSVGYSSVKKQVFIGKINEFLNIGTIELIESTSELSEITIAASRDAVIETLDKKVFSIEENLSQAGGSALQAMKNLPSITVSQDGKVQLRGSDRVTILIDGKQTALTGFGNQTGLENIPASAIERIEIINNPSAKNDANGSAGVINIVFKKNLQEGLNGKGQLIAGLGALWIKKKNYPTSRPQYQHNYKFNPSLALNYRKKNINWFFQGDLFSQRFLLSNEFIQRKFDNGTFIRHQFLENRTQTLYTVKTGMDWELDERNMITFSTMFNRESDTDLGDLPFYNEDFSERLRYWKHEETAKLTGLNTSVVYEHKFRQTGNILRANLNYTFSRENESFKFWNFLPESEGNDATKIVADENVSDLNLDYVKPLKQGRMELGSKFRWRYVPTKMVFFPGQNSILDPGAQGWANYNETIGAIYGNYVYETKQVEIEAGLRLEAVKVDYQVIPTHSTFGSGNYDYLLPFPNLRMAYLVNDNRRVSVFFNRRVDRPDEPDLRVFPKYDDPEILKTGNPNLRPQFTQTAELGYKNSWASGYFYSAAYLRFIDNIITRIITSAEGSTIVNSMPQNAGKGRNEGIELIAEQKISDSFSLNINLNGYQNIIEAFSITNVYPVEVPFSAERQKMYSGSFKLNGVFTLQKNWEIQFSSIYLAPDIIPQGRIDSRYSLDVGVTKSIQKGQGELFANANDLLNTMRVSKVITGNGFTLTSVDYSETQIFRFGYSYLF